jgi:hypothetical protein
MQLKKKNKLFCLRKILYQSITYRLLVTKPFDNYIICSWKIFRDERQKCARISDSYCPYCIFTPAHADSLHHHKSHLPVFQKYCNTSCMENGIKLFSVPSTFNLIFFCYAFNFAVYFILVVWIRC